MKKKYTKPLVVNFGAIKKSTLGRNSFDCDGTSNTKNNSGTNTNPCVS